MHLPGELALGGVGEGLPEAGRAAVVDLQHGVAAVGQELRLGVVAPGVARPRAAVDHQHGRQLLRLDAERHGQVRVQRQPVARSDLHRAHRREGRRVEPGARAVQQLRLAGLAVEEEGRARVPVVVEAQDPARLLGVLARDAGVAGVQLAGPLPVAAQALVVGVQHHPVAHVRRPEQLAGAVAQDRAGEVGLLVGVEHLLLAGGDVEAHQALQVRALRAADEEARAVGGEGVDAAAVLVGVRGHRTQLAGLVVAGQDLVVAARRLGHRRPHAPLAVGGPGDDVARVAPHQLEPAGGQREPVRVEDAAAAQVERDDDVPRGGAGHRDQAGADAGERGEVAHAARRAPGAWTLRVDRVQVVVLVAAGVLHVEDPPRVARPAVALDAAAAVGGHRGRLAARRGAHPHVQDPVQRRQPGDPRRRPGTGA